MTPADLQKSLRGWLRHHLHTEGVAPRTIAIDGVILLLVVFGLNLLMARQDLGWVERHPSPYFLLPILMGCRYGFVAGTASGLAAAIVMNLSHAYGQDLPVTTVFTDHLYLLFALLLIGGICGEIQGTFAFRLGQQTRLLDHAQRRARRLDEENYLLRAAKQEVENTLVTLNAEVSTLDFEIRRLYECADTEVFSNLINLLNRWARVQEAAIYDYRESQVLRRAAFVGVPRQFPEELTLSKNRLIATAIEQKTVVTLARLWNPFFVPTTDYLLAVPLIGQRERILAVLIVARMPFTALNRRTVHSINLICRWSARLIGERREAKGDLRFADKSPALYIRSRIQLCVALELGHETINHWQLPSSLIVFHVPGSSAAQQEQLEQALMPVVRAESVPANLSLSRAHLAIFLPLVGERETTVCRDQLLRASEEAFPTIEARIYLLDDYANTTELLRAIESTIMR